MLDQKRLKQIVTYNKNTGLFTKIKTGTVISSTNYGYLRLFIDNKRYKLHRLAWLYEFGVLPSKFIDHINGNRSDNRIVNLREVTNAENCLNQKKAKKNSSTGLLGVSKHGNGKYQASIMYKGKDIHLGTFKDPHEAYRIYLQEKKKIQGFI